MANILVIDDQDCVRQLLYEELRDEGHEVLTAADVKSVANLFEARKVDLVVMDLYLDGYEGAKLLRAMKKVRPDLPVIIFTAYDTFREDPALQEASDYIIKSMDLEPLKRAIAKGLRGELLSETYAAPDTEITVEFESAV